VEYTQSTAEPGSTDFFRQAGQGAERWTRVAEVTAEVGVKVEVDGAPSGLQRPGSVIG